MGVSREQAQAAAASAKAQAHTGSKPNGQASANPRTVTIGSDIEIAECVGADLEETFGQIVSDEGAFWRWLGTHWAPIPEFELRRAVHLYDGADYRTPAGEPTCVKLSKARVDSVLNELGAILAKPEFFASQAPGINCQSGFIRFRPDGAPCLEPHDREHRCRHVLPGHWHPGAVSVPPEGTLLATLLGGIFKGDEDEADKLDLLQEVCGSAATGYATRLVQPKAVILKGETAENGKSQCLDLARGVLPASAVSTVTASRMGDERHIIGLIGKLLNASDELSSSAAISSDRFKTIVTGEPVEGRDVYKSRVEFRPIAQHLFATNTLPHFQGGMDRGVQRRLLVIPFNRVIPLEERIEDIGKRIGEEEADLLLAWTVEGASRLIRQRKLTVPKSSQEALMDWLYSADPVLGWIHDRIEIHPIFENKPVIATSLAYSRFREWALAQGFKADLLPAINGFTQRVRANAVGVQYRRWGTGPVFLGMVVQV
jgi:P4 family phage/plasmid primase-like protien